MGRGRRGQHNPSPTLRSAKRCSSTNLHASWSGMDPSLELTSLDWFLLISSSKGITGYFGSSNLTSVSLEHSAGKCR